MSADDNWLCPMHPFGHRRTDKLNCDLCGAERSAADAITSVLSSARGWNKADAQRVRDAFRAEVLAEAADAIVTDYDRQLWASKPGKHWSADLLRRMADAAEHGEKDTREGESTHQPAERVLCTHGYVLMQDSCPGCDHESETRHAAEPVDVIPSWTPRKHRRCRRCGQQPSHRIHTNGGA